MFFENSSKTFQQKYDSNSTDSAHRFVATVSVSAITNEQVERAISQLHEDLEYHQKEREVLCNESMRTAKKFISD